MIEQQVDDVPGSDACPLTQAQIDEKFAECFGLGVKPLPAAGQSLLRERVTGLDANGDMGAFFDDVCTD